MGAARDILHLNVADFAVEVERLVDSRLKTRPVIIAPEGAARAAVFDHSEEAFQAGVRKGMALKRALRYCKDAVVLPPHPDRYERAMREMLGRALPYSPLIEQTDTQGHLFVDLSGTSRLHGPPQDVGWRIRKTLHKDVGFLPIWTVAPNKLLAKVASRLVKPTGERIVTSGEESRLLRPLPLHMIPGLEASDVFRLRDFNLRRVGEATQLTPAQLDVIFGKRAATIHNLLRGMDDSPVLPVDERRPRIIADHDFGNDTNDLHRIEGALYALVEEACADVRKRGMAAKRMGLWLDYSDGKRMHRTRIIKPPSANDFTLFEVAQDLLHKAWMRRVRIRHMRLRLDRLSYPTPPQLDLFEDIRKEQNDKHELVATLDAIRDRFGTDAVRMGRTISGDGRKINHFKVLGSLSPDPNTHPPASRP